MLIRHAEIDRRGPFDVRVEGALIREIATELTPRDDEQSIDAAGGTLLPGLHDHHIHLFAAAAAQQSVACGPQDIANIDALGAALRSASRSTEWIRGVGYHESVAGPLDRDLLDRLIADRPLRIQHRSGAMWIVNSFGARSLGLDDPNTELPDGVERDPSGRANGRLFRADQWIREHLGTVEPPDLRSFGQRLAAYGVTGATDATVNNGPEELRALTDAVANGALPLSLLVMGRPDLPQSTERRVLSGALKIVLDERAPPELAELEGLVREAHRRHRAVAFHCVTRTELVLAAATLETCGTRDGDRVEHAGVAPPELVRMLTALRVTVVTQPSFIRERGDAYLRDVETNDQPWLYPCRSLLEAGVAVGGSTDAPYGSPDPWLAMQTAVTRRTLGGHVLGAAEAVTPEQALALFTTSANAPGGTVRTVAAGQPADLCLLARPWAEARERLSADLVVATVADGAFSFRADR